MFKNLLFIVILLLLSSSVSYAVDCGTESILVVYNNSTNISYYDFNGTQYILNSNQFAYHNCSGQVNTWLSGVSSIIIPIVGSYGSLQQLFTEFISFGTGCLTALAFVLASLYRWH